MTRGALWAAVALMAAACGSTTTDTTQGDPVSTAVATSITTSEPTTSTMTIDLDSVVPPLPYADEDLGDFLVRCYAEFGIVAVNLKREYPDAVITAPLAISTAPNQDPVAKQKASDECFAVAMDVGLAVDWTDQDQLREVYRETIKLLECMDEHGYPTPDLPSEDVFVESQGAFDPYVKISGTAVHRQLAEDCPSEYYGIVDLSEIDLNP